ncbi:RacO protein [Nocardia terpenica]|uniref:DUF6192 family protein n=1 Tax=Nocardia terpenica TaxID=455432 RepID=UPI0018958521|nr:DUF6192 family protein [Nocardia terpenica]MBF6066377.1 RacO protein [Nocardia terpenica]MBF6109433.1 RacO protein [Nocardia terpenica]MBF6116624.1 RacO protein [Nocardia terpenica]MBF6123859.1 RacO protein [Nocardia terpenica]MBF6157211.1 RacO protein [Nocardia terpenica]
MSEQIGCVSEKRYEEIVAESRKLVALKTSVQFRIGDMALEIEPMRWRGGPQSAVSESLVSAMMERYGTDIGLAGRTVGSYRWTAAHWPAEYRLPQVPFEVHRILAYAGDEAFELIKHLPEGQRRWTPDAAKRVVGERPEHPTSVQERVEAIHRLAHDDHVAARVATDFLHRPEVAARVVADPTARFQVNSAQVDRSRVTCEIARDRTPAIARLEHTAEFMELVGACQAFTASVGRVIPALRGHEFTPDERNTVHSNVARVRATADWVESAVDSGNMTLDEGFARLLRNE